MGWSFLTLVGGGVTPYLRVGAVVRLDRFEPGDLGGPGTSESGFGGSVGDGVSIPLEGTNALVGTHFITGRNVGVWGIHVGIGVALGAALGQG